MTFVNLRAVTETIAVIKRDHLSEEGQNELFRQVARDTKEGALDEWRRAFGKVPAFQQIVDGSFTEPISQAENSVILQVAPIGVVAQFVWNLLKQNAKVRTDPPGLISGFPPGRYKNSFELEINGRPVANEFNLGDVDPADVIVIASLVPYARVLEQNADNKAAGATLPGTGGLLQSVAAATERQFGKTVFVKFIYELFPGAGPEGPASRRRTDTQKATDDRFPAIVIRGRT